MADGWCTIESDPGVFTELIQKFGVKDVQVEELYSLDDASLDALKPVHGLVFLFKWQAAPEVGEAAAPKYTDDVSLFFAKQVVQNACATQALLAILLNSKDVELGPILANFREFTTGMDPDTTGLTISNQEEIRAAHNSFNHPGLVHVDDPQGKAADAFHFISYVPHNGHLVELDGLKPAPIDHGEIAEGSSWTSLARTVVEARMQQYAASEVRFNLMALVGDRRKEYAATIEASTARLAGAGLEDAVSAQLHAEVASLRARLGEEEAKHARWHDENIRRKHNFLPLCLELFKALATANKLGEAVKTAKTKANEKASSAAAGAGAGGPGSKRKAMDA